MNIGELHLRMLNLNYILFRKVFESTLEIIGISELCRVRFKCLKRVAGESWGIIWVYSYWSCLIRNNIFAWCNVITNGMPRLGSLIKTTPKATPTRTAKKQ